MHDENFEFEVEKHGVDQSNVNLKENINKYNVHKTNDKFYEKKQ